MNPLHVRNLTKTFPAQRTFWGAVKNPPFTAVNNISFEVKEGEILGLLGPNGAGKTTTIQMLLSTLKPTSGDITYFGKNFFTNRSEILTQIGFASAYVGLPKRLTVRENLEVYGRLYGLNRQQRQERIKKYLEEFGVDHLANRETGALSAGETTRVMLAKAFLSYPKIVLLDEPTAALDPDIAQDIRQFILKRREKDGVSFLFTSHNMGEVTEVCDRVLVLQQGQIIADNTPEALAAKVSMAHLELLVNDLEKAIACVTERGLPHEVHGHLIEIEVDEHAIAQILQELTRAGVTYTQISIRKPQLEDYFVMIAKQTR